MTYVDVNQLTPKEMKVLDLHIRYGLRQGAIARALKIEELTVKTHLRNIRKKLRASIPELQMLGEDEAEVNIFLGIAFVVGQQIGYHKARREFERKRWPSFEPIQEPIKAEDTSALLRESPLSYP